MDHSRRLRRLPDDGIGVIPNDERVERAAGDDLRAAIDEDQVAGRIKQGIAASVRAQELAGHVPEDDRPGKGGGLLEKIPALEAAFRILRADGAGVQPGMDEDVAGRVDDVRKSCQPRALRRVVPRNHFAQAVERRALVERRPLLRQHLVQNGLPVPAQVGDWIAAILREEHVLDQIIAVAGQHEGVAARGEVHDSPEQRQRRIAPLDVIADDEQRIPGAEPDAREQAGERRVRAVDIAYGNDAGKAPRVDCTDACVHGALPSDGSIFPYSIVFAARLQPALRQGPPRLPREAFSPAKLHTAPH